MPFAPFALHIYNALPAPLYNIRIEQICMLRCVVYQNHTATSTASVAMSGFVLSFIIPSFNMSTPADFVDYIIRMHFMLVLHVLIHLRLSSTPAAFSMYSE